VQLPVVSKPVGKLQQFKLVNRDLSHWNAHKVNHHSSTKPHICQIISIHSINQVLYKYKQASPVPSPLTSRLPGILQPQSPRPATQRCPPTTNTTTLLPLSLPITINHLTKPANHPVSPPHSQRLAAQQNQKQNPNQPSRKAEWVSSTTTKNRDPPDRVWYVQE
jgi:hypothetical protein